MDRCTKCRALPSGIEGHDGLFTHRMAGSQMQFKCADCGLLWTRTYAGEGAFQWMLATGEILGPELPRGRHPG